MANTDWERFKEMYDTAKISGPPVTDDGNWHEFRYAVMAQQAGGIGAAHAANSAPRTSNSLKSMIASRLHLHSGCVLPFDFVECHKHAVGEHVSVFLVLGDKAVTLEDEFGLFPSDKLITQLRLLMNKSSGESSI